MSKPTILIVDDNYSKIQGITAALKDFDFDFDTVLSSRCALQKMKVHQFDLLVIDLQIPEALGEDIDQEGGLKLLKNIPYNPLIKKPRHIVGFTSHKDSYDQCKDDFESSGWSIHLFNGDYDLIKSVITSQIDYSNNGKVSCDIAILTALEHTELEAVLNKNLNWEEVSEIDDCSKYYKGRLTNRDGKSLVVVAASCHGMGMANASAITMKMCLKFNPTYFIMTGIAAGIENKVNLGDILVADLCWDWGNGKQTIRDGKPVFLAAPKQEVLNETLRIKLRTLVTNRDYLEEIYNSWPSSSRPEHALSAHLGPIATGAVVLEDPNVVEAIKYQNRETIGIEMEAYGVLLATRLSGTLPPHSIIIKSVCDFADPSKDDNYQGYAAHTSTSYAFKIIENILVF